MTFWLSEFDPRVVQGILTFGAAVTASLTALIVAFVAYPWQKERDHKFELVREQRNACRDYLAAMNRLFTAIVSQDLEVASREQMFLHQAASDFVCFSSMEAAVASRNYIDAVQNYRHLTFHRAALKRDNFEEWKSQREDARNSCMAARSAMLVQMRADLLGEDLTLSTEIMKAHFPSVN